VFNILSKSSILYLKYFFMNIIIIYLYFWNSNSRISCSFIYICRRFDRNLLSHIFFLWSTHMNSLRSTASLQLNFSFKNIFNNLIILRYSVNIILSPFGMNLNIKSINYKYLILESTYSSAFSTAFLNTSSVIWLFHSFNKSLSAHLLNFFISM